jgi:hypothetical protein
MGMQRQMLVFQVIILVIPCMELIRTGTTRMLEGMETAVNRLTMEIALITELIKVILILWIQMKACIRIVTILEIIILILVAINLTIIIMVIEIIIEFDSN